MKLAYAKVQGRVCLTLYYQPAGSGLQAKGLGRFNMVSMFETAIRGTTYPFMSLLPSNQKNEWKLGVKNFL